MNRLFKKIFLIVGLLTGAAFSQNTFPALVDFLGVPSGSCHQDFFAQNDITGDLYTCTSSNWVMVGGANSGSVLNVQSYGVKGDGTTDDTAAFQNAINAACGSTLGSSQGATLVIPKFFQIKITSTININQCGGLVLNGQGANGQAGFNALIIWAGGNGGTVFSINRTRDSIFEGFGVQVLNSSNLYNIAFDLDENSGSGILSHNIFRDLQVGGYPGGQQNSNYIGFRIGQNAPGNTEQQIFQNVVIGCGSGSLSDTSNGRAWYINPTASGAQPFYVLIQAAEVSGCSHGVEIAHNTRQVIIDGGNWGSNYHSLYLDGGTGVVFENAVTTLDVSSSIYLNGYAGTLEIRNNSFTGGGSSVIDVTNASAGAKVTIEDNDFGGVGMLNSVMNGGSYSGYLYIKGNGNFTGCPTQANSFLTAFRNIPTSGTCDEIYGGSPGAMAFDFTSRNDAVNNSPLIRFCGAYQSGASSFAADCWPWQDIVGSGVNGTSTLVLSHSGTTGALLIDFTVAAFKSPVTVSGSGASGVTPQATTVGALPSAAANSGMITVVNDSTSIGAEGQTCTGNSSNVALAFSNGSVWKCF